MHYNLLVSEGAIASAETYDRLFSMHGIVMVWFFLVPAVPATIGNFVVPLMIGARDLAFPKLNLLSWYIFIIGGILGVITIVAGGGDTGWTFYPPYSTQYSNSNVVLAAVAAFIHELSAILT